VWWEGRREEGGWFKVVARTLLASVVKAGDRVTGAVAKGDSHLLYLTTLRMVNVAGRTEEEKTVGDLRIW
jgi:hypothetical protein